MKNIAPPSKDQLTYILENMRLEGSVVVWSKTYGKRKEGQACGWAESSGYQRIGLLKNKFVRAHQVAYFLSFGAWPDRYVDHIDGDRQNNSPSNLRLVDDFGNARNSRSKKNMTGYQGVSFASGLYKKAYKAEIMVDRKRRYLGRYGSAQEAYLAYVAASANLHGEHSPYAANGEIA